MKHNCSWTANSYTES